VREVLDALAFSSNLDRATNGERAARGWVCDGDELVEDLVSRQKAVRDLKGDPPPPPVAFVDFLEELVAILDGLLGCR